MDRHVRSLQLVCRVGGVSFSSLSKSNRFSAKDFQIELKDCFGVDISSDLPDVHPLDICNTCRCVLRRYEAAAKAGRGGRIIRLAGVIL